MSEEIDDGIDDGIFDEENLDREDFDREPILQPSVDYLRELTKLPKVPERLKKLFWSYYGKDILLGNLDREDLKSLNNRVGLIVAIAHITQPDYKYTGEMFLDYTNLKHYVWNQSRRGKEGFERVMQTQQTKMSIQRSEQQPSLISPRRNPLSFLFPRRR